LINCFHPPAFLPLSPLSSKLPKLVARYVFPFFNLQPSKRFHFEPFATCLSYQWKQLLLINPMPIPPFAARLSQLKFFPFLPELFFVSSPPPLSSRCFNLFSLLPPEIPNAQRFSIGVKPFASIFFSKSMQPGLLDSRREIHWGARSLFFTDHKSCGLVVITQTTSRIFPSFFFVPFIRKRTPPFRDQPVQRSLPFVLHLFLRLLHEYRFQRCEKLFCSPFRHLPTVVFCRPIHWRQ